jgi:hypothetical protein
VRAEELLTRAAAQEQSVEPGTIRRLQFQIRRVVARSPTGAVAPRRDGQGRGERDQWSFTREVATSPRVTNVSNAANDDSAELTRLLDASHFDSRDPLSIRSFRAWRDSLSQKTESVTAVGADALLLRTATSEGVLRSAELIVRRVDFRPLRQTLFFDGFGEVEIIEVSRWVSRAPLVAEGSALSPSPVAQAAPSLDALDEAEVDVRLALHNLGADLNPAIAITRSERAIEVRGRVDARSKPEIVKALDKIDAARVSLRTAPAMEPDFASSAPPIGESAEGTGPVSARPLARWLERTFGAGERSAAFVSALTTDSDKVHRRATAFVALSKRYPEQSVSHLSVAARRKLDALADAHYRDLLQGIETLDDRLAFFLGTATRPAPNRLAPRPWQASAVVIATHADRLDAAIRSVLREHDLPLPTEIGPGQAEPPALSNLREATNELWRQLSTAAPQT